jgi:hypothetical protein
MKPARRGAILPALLAIAGCAVLPALSEKDKQVEAWQATVPSAIDCSRLAATRPFEVEANASMAPDLVGVPAGPALRVRLRDLSAVTPLVDPGRQAKSGRRFAGLVPVRVETKGRYTVLVASLAWADLATADPARIVAPLDFKWLTICGTRYKSGLYALEPDRTYFVQLWDSPDRALDLMIRRLP